MRCSEFRACGHESTRGSGIVSNATDMLWMSVVYNAGVTTCIEDNDVNIIMEHARILAR